MGVLNFRVSVIVSFGFLLKCGLLCGQPVSDGGGQFVQERSVVMLPRSMIFMSDGFLFLAIITLVKSMPYFCQYIFLYFKVFVHNGKKKTCS